MRARAWAAFAFFIAAAATSAPAAQTLLFSTGFEPDTALRPVAARDCYPKGCWQFIEGVDRATGSQWSPQVWNSAVTSLHLLADRPVNAASIGASMFNEIRSIAGPKGAPTHALYSEVLQSGCCGTASQDKRSGATQNALEIAPAAEDGDLYLSYWLMYQPDLARQLDPPRPNWRYLFSWKTGSPRRNDGDYRVVVQIATWCPGASLCWETRGDNAAGTAPYVEYWRVQNTFVPVPVGRWFKFEVFWHRSAGSDGRFWAAVDGRVIADRRGPNRREKPINRILVANVYGSGAFPMYQWMDDLRIYDGFPRECADPPCAPH